MIDPIQKEKYELLKSTALFGDLDENSLLSIAEDTYLRHYEKGDILMTGESSIHKVAIIVNQGRLKVFTTNPTSKEDYTVYVLNHGHLFNVITYFDGKKDNLSAQALDDIHILHCNIDIARDWIVKYPAFNVTLIRYLSERLKLAIEYNISKTFYSVEYRLAKLIYKNGLKDNESYNLINNLSHAEIAEIIGTTRAVVNRNLQKLKKDGYIDIKHKEILIQNYRKLNAWIEKVEQKT